MTAYLHRELEESVYMCIPEQLKEALVKVVNNEPVSTVDISVRDDKMIQTTKLWLEKIIGTNDSVSIEESSVWLTSGRASVVQETRNPIV